MINRDLDGIYFRVKRDDRWQNICFSDMTDEEIDTIIGERSSDWWKAVALHLKECINKIGEEFDIRSLDSE